VSCAFACALSRNRAICQIDTNPLPIAVPVAIYILRVMPNTMSQLAKGAALQNGIVSNLLCTLIRNHRYRDDVRRGIKRPLNGHAIVVEGALAAGPGPRSWIAMIT
jgi:hypothetical protein